MSHKNASIIGNNYGRIICGNKKNKNIHMKNKLTVIALAALVFASCSKDDNDTPTGNLAETEAAVTSNFGTNVALATYTDLAASAAALNTAVNDFVADQTDEKLATCKQAWKDLRVIWETSEGFLFGPVEDNEYDPKMDTWPTDYSEMNTLLADEAGHALDLADIQTLDYSLRGFHPIEYMLWGKSSDKTAAQFTAREIKYLTSLSADVEDLCSELHADWTGGYTDKVTSAGNGSSAFATYYEFFTALNDGMIGICNEVGHSDENTGKIYEPFIAKDSNIVESPYSENSMVDFKNNIQGAYNVYLGKYKTQGTGLTDIVSSMNKDLDNQIKQKFENAISAFSTVDVSFELAIFNERTQLQGVMDAIGEVRDILEEQLQPFLLANIKN